MKRSSSFLKEHIDKALSFTSRGDSSVFRVGSPSLVSFILSEIKAPVLLVCEEGSFDDVYSSFGLEREDCVGVPFLSSFDDNDFVIHSYHKSLFECSSARLSSDLSSINCCVIDERSLSLPVVYTPADKNFTVGNSLSLFEDLMFFLSKNNYKKKMVVSSPGEFVIRGGVVDVFSYGASFPFRVGFLDKKQEVLFFDPSSGNIIKKSASASVFPFPISKKSSLLELKYFEYTSYYKNRRIYLSRGLFEFKSSFDCGSFDSFSYENYKNKKDSFSKQLFSPFLLSEGCVYSGVAYLPVWFSRSFVPLEKERVPLSGSLVVGDYFVHDTFGVCRYLGFAPKGQDKNEKIILAFADGKLSLDVRFLNYISFFASQGEPVSLNSLNKTGLWKKRKSSAQKHAEEFVGSLVESYIKRGVVSGEALRIDKDLLSLFLSEFPYVDTRDQAAAWNNILRDFSSGAPMHRLLCGDVGFGKTEIAMRASFVVCLNNKQVLVLAPTTILCRQLYGCFKDRFNLFGFTVAQVSRLSKKNLLTIKNFKNKKIDVLVSTHASVKNSSVLSSSSLVVVDEEHRFGVEHKEAVFKHAPRCHYLSMSATPIPRTLQLSLSGVRNISTLLSPPKARRPIITNIYFYDLFLIKTIILDEINRGGQTYVVDNSVNNLVFLSSFIKKEFPSFSVAVLHGSLPSSQINKTMSLFRSGKINVLVSTVIIESGIDVPSANTIIINNAHLFGLSQLHQLRGRVGRSSLQSYAFLLVPSMKKITKEGKERLDSIKQYTSLGSGYHLSLKDLEIRGSGNLFGYKQSGKNYVGFEHYSKMLYAAMKKAGPSSSFLCPEFVIEDSFIPLSFISADEQRSFYYKSISDLKTVEELNLLLSKTKNLFGPLPPPFLSLFKSKKLSLLSENTPISKVVFLKGSFSVFCSISSSLDVAAFLSKVASFFKKTSVLYSFKTDIDFLKIDFKYIKDDYYILLENFIIHLHD